MSVFERFETPDGPTCGCLGCTEPAAKVIDHPEHGERVVCEDDVGDYEVVRDV
ncbi:hypothetical protein [Halosimplex halophilum]|uniref:hypothetical protein n=1 Tax=Halosimplex halophilum TaxID=2559572 RepID=UPI001435460A|nr:hypothetical protein [Halosimplex halophilum]